MSYFGYVRLPMKIQRGKLYAVITGDIIGSSRLPEVDRRRLHQVMKRGSAKLHKAFGKAVPLDVDIFRGDSWQLLVADPIKSLRIGLFYRAFIRVKMQSNKIDTRMSIAVGTIDFIPGNRVSSGDGSAYRRSGAALAKMLRPYRICFEGIEKESEQRLNAVEAVVQLIDVLAMNWTEKQAQAITGALQGWTQEKIAKSWWENPITQQAIGQHLDKAGWYAVANGLRFFEDRVKDML